LLNERERALLLSAIEAVDRVIIFDDPDASSLIRNIRPALVVKGKHFEKQQLPEQEAIRESGAKLEPPIFNFIPKEKNECKYF